MTALCGPCTAARMAWLDFAPATVLPRLSISYGSGAAYDNTAAGAADRRNSQYNEWRTLVRTQMAAIADGCRAGRHACPR